MSVRTTLRGTAGLGALIVAGLVMSQQFGNNKDAAAQYQATVHGSSQRQAADIGKVASFSIASGHGLPELHSRSLDHGTETEPNRDTDPIGYMQAKFKRKGRERHEDLARACPEAIPIMARLEHRHELLEGDLLDLTLRRQHGELEKAAFRDEDRRIMHDFRRDWCNLALSAASTTKCREHLEFCRRSLTNGVGQSSQ